MRLELRGALACSLNPLGGAVLRAGSVSKAMLLPAQLEADEGRSVAWTPQPGP